MRHWTSAGLGAWWMFVVGPAAAQVGTAPHRIEIGGHVGYATTVGRSVYLDSSVNGELDIEGSAMWGITADINVRRGGQVSLLYNRQDGKLTFSRYPGGIEKFDVTVDYWHIGGLAGVPRGNVLPFTSFTLGATRLSVDAVNDDVWKFSVMLGLGVKAYLNERFGVRVHGRLPFTFVSGGASLACGPAGCWTSIGGSGLAQFDITGGAFVYL